MTVQKSYTSTAVRKAVKNAGAHKVSVRQSPVTGTLYYLHVQFELEGELIPITDAGVFPAEFYAKHSEIFAAINRYRGCYLTNRGATLV